MAAVPQQPRPPFGGPHMPPPQQYLPNGSIPGNIPHPAGVAGLPPNRVIEKTGARVLCIADVRGHLRTLNELAKKANADYILHTGDFGFYDESSLDRIAEKTLRHVAQYSPLLDEGLKKRIQGANAQNIKSLFRSESNSLSELPLFLQSTYTLDVPVYTVWGACEDVRVLEKFRSGEYKIPNLHIIDEANSRLLDVGGVKLRLLGLGGAVVMHKLFDNGEGKTTIAGGQGTVWTTLLQMGELVDTANRVYDPSETRIFITHNSPAREGLLNQLSVTLKADFSVSAGLHFRYGSSYNEFSVNPSLDHYRGKLASSKASFNDVWETVKGEVTPAVSQNAAQQTLLDNALAFVDKMPTSANGGNPFGGPSANAAPGAGQVDESAFKNMWNFNLADAAFGWLVLEIENGKIGTEMRAQGFSFSHRAGKSTGGHQPAQPAQPQATTPSASTAPTVPSGPAAQSSTPTPISPAVPLAPSGPGAMRSKQPQQKSTPPPEKPASPQVRHIEPAVPSKPATPRAAPAGPAGSTQVTAQPSPSESQKATPSNGAPASSAPASSTPASNAPEAEVRSSSPTPNASVPATPAAEEAPSPKESTAQVGLYITGVQTREAAEAIIPEEDRKHIKVIDERLAKSTRRPFFLVHLESSEISKEILEKIPQDVKNGGHGRTFVKLLDDHDRSYRNDSGNRPGMDASRWSRSQTAGGNTSESDNQGSGFRSRGSRGGKFRGQGGFERGPRQGRGGQGARRGSGIPQGE